MKITSDSILDPSGAKRMRLTTASLLIFATLATLGCKSSGVLAKREAEKCFPTDIRKTLPWCAGEDALFQGPCRPSSEFYGYKPTCWGIWPTSGAAWRDAHCGELHHQAIIADFTNQNRELIELPTLPTSPEATQHSTEKIEVPAKGESTGPPEISSPERARINLIVPDPGNEQAEPTHNEEDLPQPTFGLIRLPSVE